MTKNYQYFTCCRYDIDMSEKPISKVPIRYQCRYIDIGDMSTIFSIYRPTSTLYVTVLYRSKRIRCNAVAYAEGVGGGG